jgi:flagellar export protein FliJ
MAVAKALLRLLDVLEIEEDQARMAFESATAEHGQLERQLTQALQTESHGRRLVSSSAGMNSGTDRLAGLELSRLAARDAAGLQSRIERAAALLAENRELYLGKRVERRQAETLIEEARAAEQIEAGRRGQQVLDDWYLNRLHRTNLKDLKTQADSRAGKTNAEGSSSDRNPS